MSIESDAQKDLALTDEDAEGVVGGKRAKHTTKKTSHPAANTVSYTYSPGPSGPAQPYTDDGDDCADPGYAGSSDDSSTT